MRDRPISLALALMLPLSAAALLACGGAEEAPAGDDEVNPFLAIEGEPEKGDTAYVNPAGKEVEVDLEANVTVADSTQVRRAPTELGQFAETYLRKHGDFYLESLAENASSLDRVEWRIGGTWKTARQVAGTAASQLTHFRIRGVNAVILNAMAKDVALGKVYNAKVPTDPFTLMQKAAHTCAEPDGHITLDADVYWYMWDPDLSTCKLTLQTMTVTVSKLLPLGHTVYPEYDLLVADKKITSVILFGQIGDGAITNSDPGMVGFNNVARWLLGAKYTEVKPAPVGRRFTKTFNGTAMEIDLYSPKDFSGLGDYAHFANLQKAISEHEIVAYDGHSMLGASDFWSQPTYPTNYQIFLYGGCLGYEYYVRPIVEGKGGTWANLDLMSAVVEVSANAELFAVPVLAKITYALTHGYRVSYQQILSTVRTQVGDDTFGMSGVRDNCFTPAGSLCH
jgi:hypothetical protein